MKSLRPLALTLVAAASLLVAPITASADVPCRAACFQQTRRCIVDQARAGLFACKLDCATGSRADLPGCLTQCRDQFRGERALCREQLGTCNNVCTGATVPGYDSVCMDSCGTDLAACGRRVVGDARDCVTGCADFPGRLAIDCLYGCAETAKAQGIDCGTEFRSCVESCASDPSAP